ncbi:P2X purinoceptor 7-like isoform X1 [Acanthochromis polyacanthus]|uniref:P2X purinoceptor 7-like isoform X1 n=2 Tax=Acanthochromis polyacanthus TaxID=80966 RepID=UPI00223483B4|nr:P2X purinoceptor 7-like isoform X1 [Acanthochromis polyacanthus]
MSVLPRREDPGHLRAVLCLLQPRMDQDQDRKADQNPRPAAPCWCKCDRCVPASLPQEQLCCRRSSGGCISSSPLFHQLVLRRPLLEAVLPYRDPLTLLDRVWTAALHHCAYQQFISWRFGSPPAGCHPAVPSCCIQRIREEYPSPDGRYRGFRPVRTTVTMQGSANGEP